MQPLNSRGVCEIEIIPNCKNLNIMKKILFIALATALGLSTPSLGQKKVTRDVEAFSRLNFAVPGTLHLKQGSTQSVVLEGDPEILEKIETEVRDGQLSIKTRNEWNRWNWGSQKITAFVTMKTIRGLSVSGSGNMIGKGTMRAEDLDLAVSGSGKMEVEIEASGEMEADVSGSGTMIFKGSCSDIDADVSGSGNMRLALGSTKEASFEVAGSGSIHVTGSADMMETTISGSGVVRGADFKTRVSMPLSQPLPARPPEPTAMVDWMV